MRERLRLLLTALLTLGLVACSKPGIDAGHKGGTAFIALTGMLILTIVILWFFLGRQD